MEDVIKKIIEIEHEAQSLVAEGLAQEEKIQIDTQGEIKTMETNILEMSENKMGQLKARNRKEADEKLAQIHEHTTRKLEQMGEVIAKNQDLWENQIFNRIVGR